jgi:restriction system protein
MPIPDFQSVMLPLLQVLSDGKEWKMRDATDAIAARFQLSPAERSEMLPSGQQTLLSNRVGWAKTHLKGAGLILNPSRDKVSLSEEGRRVLATKPKEINCRFLRQYPSYLELVGRTRAEDTSVDQSQAAPEQEQTPLELMDQSFQALRRATADELLVKLKGCSAGFFEKVVVKLLEAMGYGGVAGEALVTGRSGDAGIDGIIKEDKLGLDVVCIQAKRWENTTVGRPVIQGFVGSMDFVRARKGVILTTSQFSRDAIDFVDRIEGKKVVLIDGPQLAELMIEHNVGVLPTKSYELKEVSNDFFDEDEG